MKVILLVALSIAGTVQAMSSLRLSKRMIEIFRPLTIERAVTVDSSAKLARVVDKFQIGVVFTRRSYQRHLSRVDNINDHTRLRSKWQEWAVATKDELRQLTEGRQHLIDKDILANLNAIDAELQGAHVIGLW